MNKLTKFMALTLAVSGAATLAACGTARSVTSTSPNWNVRVVNGNDLNENSDWLTMCEVATYSISFTAPTNLNYQFEYNTDETAKYVTRFYAESYDRSGAPEGFAADKAEYVYVYETSLTLSGRVVYGSDKHDFTNTVKTVSKFRSAENNLQPVYSRQEIKNTAPANITVTNIKEAYVETDCTYETYFSDDGTRAKIDCSDDRYDKLVDVPTAYSVFEATQLGAAFRSFDFSGSYLFDIFSAIEGGTAQYNATFSDSLTLNNEANARIAAALNGACDEGYLFVGSDENGQRSFKYTAMVLSKASSMSGQMQQFWFASVENAEVNTARAVMLCRIEPLSFGQGALTYTLSSLEKEEV